MDSEFAQRLEEFLSSECGDYDLAYSWKWDDDFAYCEVTIVRDSIDNRTISVPFRYQKGSLIIEMCEDVWQTVREYDATVKYFWMKISPIVFRLP